MGNRLKTYFDRTQVSRRDFFRQLIFLTFVPSTILLITLHLAGSYGLTLLPARVCSACCIAVSVVALGFYLWKGPKMLRRILPAYFLSLTLIQCVRLSVLAAMGQHHPMLTTVNLMVCYLAVLMASVSILPRVALVCTGAILLAMTFCLCVTRSPMYATLLLVYGILGVVTTIFSFVAYKMQYEQQMELHDYASTIDKILRVFNMNKAELIALLKLAKANGAAKVYDEELLRQLDRKTLRNIIQMASQIEQMQVNQRRTVHDRFPMLTPAELDVCRLVEQGLTLKQIANALDKSVSNVSTVRGNIRKKLRLAQDDDLRNFLLRN